MENPQPADSRSRMGTAIYLNRGPSLFEATGELPALV